MLFHSQDGACRMTGVEARTVAATVRVSTGETVRRDANLKRSSFKILDRWGLERTLPECVHG
jgi:hypothetical protein